MCRKIRGKQTGSDGKHFLHHKQLVLLNLKLAECQPLNNVSFYYNDGIFYYDLKWYALGRVNALNPIWESVAPKPECFLPLQGTAALTRSQQFQ